MQLSLCTPSVTRPSSPTQTRACCQSVFVLPQFHKKSEPEMLRSHTNNFVGTMSSVPPSSGRSIFPRPLQLGCHFCSVQLSREQCAPGVQWKRVVSHVPRDIGWNSPPSLFLPNNFNFQQSGNNLSCWQGDMETSSKRNDFEQAEQL